MFEIVNGIETYRNEDVNIWKCNGCGCWREVEEKRCTICFGTRTALPGDDGPPIEKPVAKRRERSRAQVSAVGAAELHKVREREAKKSEKPAK
jgi:hypothetical protein